MVLPYVNDNGLQAAHVTWLSRDGKTKLNSSTPKKTYGKVADTGA